MATFTVRTIMANRPVYPTVPILNPGTLNNTSDTKRPNLVSAARLKSEIDAPDITIGSGRPALSKAIFKFNSWVSSLEEALLHIINGLTQTRNIRSTNGFHAISPEPITTSRASQICGGQNPPRRNQLIGRNTALSPRKTTQQTTFLWAATNPKKPVVCSCETSVTAALSTLGPHCISAGDIAVYDTSLAKWGNRATTQQWNDE